MWNGTWELQNREITTRKTRSCEWCGEVIEKGSRCQYRVYVFDGFTVGHQHPECYIAMLNIPYWVVDQGWTIGQFARGSLGTANWRLKAKEGW